VATEAVARLADSHRSWGADRADGLVTCVIEFNGVL
jgi:hypothetical protein